MLHITKLMIQKYNINDIDFMGYFINEDNASYHHLIIPKRNGGPKTISNGAILNKETSHSYLHLIEKKDYEVFYDLTREMIKENKLGKIDMEILKRIDDILNYFEKEHSQDTNFNGEMLIREDYIKRLLKERR
ncbi:MAG: hypothetical protein IJ568_00245 [Bacilli bacterium]|nr:hypothetical protein [Bacilli bacterium]